jgi:hypothetical protein
MILLAFCCLLGGAAFAVCGLLRVAFALLGSG